MKPHYKNSPAKYINFLLSHEGENSLLSYLIELGLAESLVGDTWDCMRLFSVLEFEIILTKKGT